MGDRGGTSIVSELLDAFNARDRRRGMELLDPELEFSYPSEFPGAGGVHRGREAALDALRQEAQAWSSHRIELVDATEGPDGTVLAELTERTSGRSSGIGAEQRSFAVFRLRDERVTSMHWFLDGAEARRAAGVSGD